MEEKIKSIKIIHFAICLGTILAYIFVGKISIDKLKFPEIDSSSIVYLIIPIIAFGLSNFLFNSQLKQVDSKLKLDENFAIYQTASIIRWAILEGSAFMILFLKPDFIILGLLIILYLAFLRPSEERMKKDLQYMD